ncbi:MAG: hypothetical protein EA417_06350 [Gammaproteobacteria bacterium]|nr:MAG: hypothetical protein EA417_06350 [Gammaproteobacteria bacterium]
MTDLRPTSRPPPADLAVVPHRPHRERKLVGLAMIAVLVAAVLGWGVARMQMETSAVQIAAELDGLSVRHAVLLAERDRLEAALSEAHVGQQVGTGFDDHVRTTLKEQSVRIAALEDEVRFYRNIMASDASDGVQIARLELLERIDGRGVRFRLLLVQISRQREEVSGHVELHVVGERGGAADVFEIEHIGDAHYPMPFRFRYFQDLVGEIELPEGFRPDGIQVIARGAEPDGFRLERTFSWQMQEV